MLYLKNLRKILYFFFVFVIYSQSFCIADTIATHHFTTISNGTVDIVISGNLNSGIYGQDGSLVSNLNMNFKITSNETIGNLQLKAYILNDGGSKESAIQGTSASGVQNVNFDLVFGNNTSDSHPSHSAIVNCKDSMICCPECNPNAIAYNASATIDNSGVFAYVEQADASYYKVSIGQEETNINLSFQSAAVVGTYDAASALDEEGSYDVEICIENIPSI